MQNSNAGHLVQKAVQISGGRRQSLNPRGWGPKDTAQVAQVVNRAFSASGLRPSSPYYNCPCPRLFIPTSLAQIGAGVSFIHNSVFPAPSMAPGTEVRKYSRMNERKGVEKTERGKEGRVHGRTGQDREGQKSGEGQGRAGGAGSRGQEAGQGEPGEGAGGTHSWSRGCRCRPVPPWGSCARNGP